MVHAKEAADAAADDVAAGTLSAQAILESAFYRTNVQGGHHVLTIFAWHGLLCPWQHHRVHHASDVGTVFATADASPGTCSAHGMSWWVVQLVLSWDWVMLTDHANCWCCIAQVPPLPVCWW
jgi:hypothetical protein